MSLISLVGFKEHELLYTIDVFGTIFKSIRKVKQLYVFRVANSVLNRCILF